MKIILPRPLAPGDMLVSGDMTLIVTGVDYSSANSRNHLEQRNADGVIVSRQPVSVRVAITLHGDQAAETVSTGTAAAEQPKRRKLSTAAPRPEPPAPVVVEDDVQLTTGDPQHRYYATWHPGEEAADFEGSGNRRVVARGTMERMLEQLRAAGRVPFREDMIEMPHIAVQPGRSLADILRDMRESPGMDVEP